MPRRRRIFLTRMEAAASRCSTPMADPSEREIPQRGLPLRREARCE